MNSTIIPPANISLIFDFHECDPKYIGVIKESLYIVYALPSSIKIYKINKVGEIFNIVSEKTIYENIYDNNDNIECKCTNNFLVYYSLSNMNTSIGIGSIESEKKNIFYFPTRGKLYTLNDLPDKENQVMYFTDTNRLVFYKLVETDNIFMEYLFDDEIDTIHTVYDILIKGETIIVVTKYHDKTCILKYSYNGYELTNLLIKDINNGALKDYELKESTLCITNDKLYCQTRNTISNYDLESFNIMNEITFSLSNINIVYNYNKKPKHIDVDGEWMKFHWANKIYFKHLTKDVNNYMFNSDQTVVKYKGNMYQLTNNRMYKYDTPETLLKNDTWNRRKISLLLMKRYETQLKNMNLEMITSCYWAKKRNYELFKDDYIAKRNNDIELTRRRQENEKLLKNMEMSYNVSISGSYKNLATDIGVIREYLCVDRDKNLRDLELNTNLLRESEEKVKIVGGNLLKSEIEYIYCMMSNLPNEIERHIIEWV